MFGVCIDAPEGSSYYPKNIMFQFYICSYKNCYATWMFLEKLCYIKTNIHFRNPGTDLPLPQSVGSRTLFYPMSIMPKIFIEDSGNLKHPKNVKSISNTTVSHLVSCRLIPATMMGWEKEVFWKIHALGNLKCNKSNNLKSK